MAYDTLASGQSVFAYVMDNPLRYTDRFGTNPNIDSLFNPDGTLTDNAINNSKVIFRPEEIKNSAVPRGLSKMTTGKFCPGTGGPQYETHYYQDTITGEPYYDLDYKTRPSGKGPNPLRPGPGLAPEQVTTDITIKPEFLIEP